jgi:CMP-N-acetylneuraminic acid synthetase
MSKILGIIPARKGSTRVPNKNIREINGRPLITYIMETAKKSEYIDRLIVSTDDERVIRLANEYDIEVPFVRPKELSDDKTILEEVNLHAMKFFDQKGWKPKIVVSIQPTNPLTKREDIDRCIEKLINANCDSVSTVFKSTVCHPYWALRLENDKLIPHSKYFNDFLNSQDLPSFYYLSGGVIARRRKVLENCTCNEFALGNDSRAVIVDEYSAIDINTEMDLLFVKFLMENIGIRPDRK